MPASSRPSPASALSSMHSASCSDRFSSSAHFMRSKGDCFRSIMKSAFKTMLRADSFSSMAVTFCVMPVRRRPNLRPSLAKRLK